MTYGQLEASILQAKTGGSLSEVGGYLDTHINNYTGLLFERSN